MKWAVVVVLLAGGLSAASPAQEQQAQELVRAGRFEQARRAYRVLSEAQPEQVEYMVWVGRLSGWLRDYPAAISAFDAVLERDPRSLEAILGKVYVYLWQRRFGEAELWLDRAEPVSPGAAEVELAWARRYYYAGRQGEARAHLKRALAADAKHAEAQTMLAELPAGPAAEAIWNYTHDRFSFTGAGDSGGLDVSWLGRRVRPGIHYEEWSRFGRRITRGGVGATLAWGGRWTLQASAVIGSNQPVLARSEFAAGVSRKFSGAWVPGAGYRVLNFSAARIQVLSPYVEHYFSGSTWLSTTVFVSRTTRADAIRAAALTSSMLTTCHRRVSQNVLVSAGYARGTESFSGLSADRLAQFRANTYLGGAEYRFGASWSAGMTYMYQCRSNGGTQQSLSLRIAMKR